MAVQKANYIHRDFEVDGVSASGFHQVIPREERVWGTWVEGAINAGLSNGGLGYDTKANMDADLDHPAAVTAWVIGDPVVANNGIYRKSGASGSGSWTKIGELPYSIVYAQNDGSGTADAVVATSSVPIVTTAYSQLISVPFTASNSGAMTLSIDGETPRPLVTNTGEPIPAGYVSAGMSALVQIDGAGNYRLFSYGDAAAVQAAVEVLKSQTETVRDEALAAVPNAFPMTVASLKSSIDPATHIAAYLLQPARAGQFRWENSDQSANIALDTAEGIYIAPASDPTGTSGAWVRVYDGPIKARWFGVVGDYNGILGTDNSPALSVLAAVYPAGATIDFEGLRLRHASNVIWSRDVYFTGDGTGEIFSDGCYFWILGTQTEVGAILDGAAPAGRAEINVTSTAGIAADDLLVIQDTTAGSFYSSSIDDRDYQEGEWLEVRSVETGVVTMKRPPVASYSGDAADKIYKISPVKFRSKGVNFRSTGVFGLRVALAVDVVFDGTVRGGTVAALTFQQVYGWRLENVDCLQDDTLSGNDYGFSVANCSKGYVAPGCSFWGGRHGVSIGGATGEAKVTNRGIVFDQCLIAAGTPALQAADMHGWSDECYFRDCQIFGAVSIGGTNCGAPGSSVIANDAFPPIRTAELVGGKIDFRNMKVMIGPNNTSYRVVGIASSAMAAQTKQTYQILTDGLDAELSSVFTTVIGWYHAAPAGVKWSINAGRMKVRSNNTQLTSYITATIGGTGVGPTSIVLNEVDTSEALSALSAVPNIIVPSGGWALGSAFIRVPQHSGSNANGEFTVFPDGTMICRKIQTDASQAINVDFMGGKRSPALTWTYPKTFAANPTLELTPTSASAIGAVGSTVGTSSATFFVTAVTEQTAATRTTMLEATGRLF